MPDLNQTASWPGIVGVATCKGTVSHGITPGRFVLTSYPQTGAPQAYGTLSLSDGTHSIAFRRCKIDQIGGTAGPSGQTWEFEIVDRRWRWRSSQAAFGVVSGRYNRPDVRGKLVPWSIRSPEELARICLDALGERNYQIDLPRGLTRSAGRDLDRYLRLGENFAQSLANPETFWDTISPAEALARLCDYYGRRVVYQPVADRIVIARLGVGKTLPENAPYEVKTPSLTLNTAPARVVVAGAPVRVQARFRLEAVGREWDDSYLPLNDLSYAPRGNGKKQITTVTFTGGDVRPLGLRIDWQVGVGDAYHRLAVVFAGGAAATIADRWAELLALMAAQPFELVVSVAVSGDVLTLTGLQDGQAFEVTLTTSVAGGDAGDVIPYQAVVVQEPQYPGPTWDYCYPPLFNGIRPTDQLSYAEALERAQDTVYRCYRIVNVDPATRKAPMTLPWFGKIKRRQQIVLQPSKVEQVVPTPRIAGGANKGNPAPGGTLGQGILPEYYNGYSSDRKATVTGSVSVIPGTVAWNPGGWFSPERFPNTLETDRVFVPFEVEPIEQIVKFHDYVYRQKFLADGFLILEIPDLILETGCLVADADTDQVVRWSESLPLGGPAPDEWVVREDLQAGVIGRYGANHALQSYSLLDQNDMKQRAEYYLKGLAAKYRVTGAETRQYVGILAIDLDGAIQQVSWSMGAGGPSTSASVNCEHSPAIPTYPARRKQENLSPNASAAAANTTERAPLERLYPQPPSGR